MKNIIDGKWYISTTCQGEVIDLPFSVKYGRYLNDTLEQSANTIKKNMGALERFWKWTLSVQPNSDEDFSEYLARYKQELKNGIIIYDRDPEDSKSMKFPVLTLKPKSKVSIDTELSSLNSYFTWIDDKKINLGLTKNTINWNYENRRRKASRHSDYISGKINSFALERISKKNMFGSKKTKRNVQTDKTFPFRYFLLLIESADIREKLLYLLMGGTSARICQALNLTIEDIDYVNKEVYLSDPVIDDPSQEGLLGKGRRNWLMSEYGIDAQNDSPHNNVLFKYHIPSVANKPLYWLNESFREMFFELLVEYNIYPMHLRNPRHPFFFTKKDGGRLLYRSALNKFKKNSYKLYEQIQSELVVQPLNMSNKEYEEALNDSELLIDVTPHALRHMYGNYMAELFYRASLSMLPVEAERIRIYCQQGMGHSDSKSTAVYFNAKMNKVIEAGETYFVHYIRDHKYLPATLFIKGLAA